MKKLRADWTPEIPSTILSRVLCLPICLTLPVVLYGYENRSFTFWDVARLRIFANRVMRNIFLCKRHGVTGDWRRLHIKKSMIFFPSGIIWVINQESWEERGMWNVRGKTHIGFWWGKLRNRTIGRHRRRWEDNIWMNLKEISWDGVDWIDLVQDRNM